GVGRAGVGSAGRRVGRRGRRMIVRRSQAEIAKLRRANQLVGTVLGKLRAMVAPGVTTAEMDAAAEAMVLEAGGTPAFKGYHGYPAPGGPPGHAQGGPRIPPR